MTLDLGGFVEDLVTSDTADKTVIDRVEYRVRKIGFTAAEPLKRKGQHYIPKLPSKGVSRLTDAEVTDLQAQFVTMTTYAGEQALIQDTMAAVYSVEAKRMKARVRLKATGTASEREDKATIHPKVVELEDKAMVAKFSGKRIQERREGFEKSRGVCSRDVERRKLDKEQDRRDNAIRGTKRVRRGPSRQRDLEVSRGE